MAAAFESDAVNSPEASTIRIRSVMECFSTGDRSQPAGYTGYRSTQNTSQQERPRNPAQFG